MTLKLLLKKERNKYRGLRSEMHVVIVDENNRLIADIDYAHKQCASPGIICDIDFFENDIRIRIKKDLVPDDKNNIQVEFYEDKDTDTVSAHFGDSNG